MPPADPQALIPMPPAVPANRDDPFHQEPAFDRPPYAVRDDDEADPKDTALEKAHNQSLDEAKDELRALTNELRTADNKRIKQLSIKVQRQRVTVLLLQEAHTGIADPSTHRELSLLNKLVAGRSLDEMDEEQAREETQQRQQAAVSRLQARGASEATAQRVVRVLGAVMRQPTPLKPNVEPAADVEPQPHRHAG